MVLIIILMVSMKILTIRIIVISIRNVITAEGVSKCS